MAYVLRVEPAKRDKYCSACRSKINKGDIHIGTWAGNKSNNSKGNICRKCIIKFYIKIKSNSGSESPDNFIKERKVKTIIERTSSKRECKHCGNEIVKDTLCVKIDSGASGTACGSVCGNCMIKIGGELYDENMVEEIFKESL